MADCRSERILSLYAERSFSIRQFQRTRNSIHALRCTQFSTAQRSPFMQSLRSLLAVSRVECVKQGETLYYSLVRVKQDERMKISDLVHEIRAVLSNIDIENLSITLKKLHASRSIEINLVQ